MILDRLLGRSRRRPERDEAPAPAGVVAAPAPGPLRQPDPHRPGGPARATSVPVPVVPGVPPVPAGAVVRGAVSTRDGWPLPGASVTVLSGAGAASARTASGSDGRFSLLGVPAGASTVLVAAPGHEPQVRAVSIASDPGEDAAPAVEVGTVRLVRQDDTSAPPAGRWDVDPLHTSIVAAAHHLGLSAVRGRLDLAEGAITVAEPFTDSTVEVTIAAASIDTGVAQRDDHLRSGDFLDVAVHPTITYRGTGLTPTAGGTWVMNGHLTLLGEVREVPLELEATGTGQDPWGGTRTAFRATATLARDDFRMNWNQAVGLGVAVFGTTLRITIDLEAVLQT